MHVRPGAYFFIFCPAFRTGTPLRSRARLSIKISSLELHSPTDFQKRLTPKVDPQINTDLSRRSSPAARSKEFMRRYKNLLEK